jgi:hypothetical protein
MKNITKSILVAGIAMLTQVTVAQVGVGTTVPVSDLSVFGNTAIGTTYSEATTAPINGLRVEGHSVIGKSSGEDSRDMFSAHTSETAFNNITGYGGDTAARAISGYSEGDGIGVLGYASRTGYGVIGLAHANSISTFVQQGEGVLGQADGRSGATSIPIGVHGIIDESTNELYAATPVLGENNNATIGFGLGGGAYNGTIPAVSGVYGNIGTRVSNSNTNAYQFGIVGDILLLGVANQPDASGGVLGTNASSDYGILGYKSSGGTLYSGYFANSGNISTTGTDRQSNNPETNNSIGIGVHGGFLGGYITGKQYGMIAQGDDFGMYVQGNTLVNEPIVQLIAGQSGKRAIAYTPTSTSIDATTRGKGQLVNGKAFIVFDNSFKNMISKRGDINITVTPTGETNGVYVSKVTSEGFFIKENMQGNNNASFNWTAIGTRKGYENGIEVSDVILSNTFDKNMNKVMVSDGSDEEGSPIYFDGNDIRFERIPDGIIKYNKKEAPKRK